jgi:hypothetical protein
MLIQEVYRIFKALLASKDSLSGGKKKAIRQKTDSFLNNQG